MNRKLLLALLISLSLNFPVFSDTRNENIDIFILLDKSLSMEGKIESVNEYINNFIVDRIIIPGDMLYVINFYGKTDILFNSVVTDDNHKTRLKSLIKSVQANGRYTDIGNALDSLAGVIPQFEQNNRLKYMLLITDGKQEAPPESSYYSPDGSFNHRFLEHTKVIEKQGWKIHILGIGKFTDAKAIAEKLSGTYSEVSGSSDSPELLTSEMLDATSDFLSVFRITSNPKIFYKGLLQKPYLSFKTETANLDSVKNIEISSIFLKSDFIDETDILESISINEFTDNGEKEVIIPLTFPASMPSGTYNGEIKLSYTSRDVFTPSVFEIDFTIKNLFSRYYLIFVPSLIIILLILVFVIIKLKSSLFSAKKKNLQGDISFYCYIDGKKIQELPFILKNMDKLYINLSPSGLINFSKQKYESSKAMITAKGNFLSMDIFDKSFIKDKKERFDNILENSFNFIKKNGKQLLVDFKRK